jgi:hypothetical protein
MYDLVDILKSNIANPGAGGGIKSIIFAILLGDIKIFPARGADLVTITSPFELNAGKYAHQIYATGQTIQPKETKLNGDNKDSGGVEVSLEFFHPDLNSPIQEFKAKHMNSPFILLFQNYAASKTYLIGEPCNPVYMDAWESTWGKTVAEGKGTTFTFKSQQSLPMAIYSSSIEDLLEEASGSLSPSTSVSPSGI